MTNEQTLNAMIPGAMKRLEDAGSHEYIGATAMVSASDIRALLAHVAALKADAERERDRREADFQEMLKAEHRISGAYVELRSIIGAMNPPSTQFESLTRYVSMAARKLVDERDALKQRLADSGCDLQAIKASPAPEQEPSAWRIKQGARVYLISHAEFVRTSFDAASMTPLYEKPLQSIDHAPAPAPGEWVEWKGGECPIADGVKFRFKFRDGSQNNDSEWTDAPNWIWANRGYPGDIVAYRIIP